MAKAVSTTEAKNKLTALIRWVREHQDAVIVESHGEPSAVLMSFAEYEKLNVLKEQERRRVALEQLRQLRAEVRARNQDIETEEQAFAIADRLVREVVDDMVAEGKIVFERDS